MIKLHEPVIDEAECNAVAKVLASGWLAEGNVTRDFERKIAEYVGAEHAVAVSNCTVALELCLKAIFKTDWIMDTIEAIVLPDFSHPATIQAAINAGILPTLEDVELDSYNIETNHLVMNGKMVMPVSWAGNPIFYDIVPLKEPILEDAACSLGSILWNGHKTGSGITTCFSFHPRKLITCGEGGMVTTNNQELANRIRDFKNFGVGGGNYKLDDVRAAIGLAQMDKLERIIARRIEMAKIYEDLLKPYPWIKPPQKHPNARHTYQTYAVYLERGNRDEIMAKLALKGIQTQIGAYALHLLPAYQDVERIGTLENSEKLYRNLLALPMAYSLTDEDQKRVVHELAEAIHD